EGQADSLADAARTAGNNSYACHFSPSYCRNNDNEWRWRLGNAADTGKQDLGPPYEFTRGGDAAGQSPAAGSEAELRTHIDGLPVLLSVNRLKHAVALLRIP